MGNRSNQSAPSAEAGLREYYSVLNRGNLLDGWSRLTPDFQRKYSRNSFDSYTSWWTQVQRTDLREVSVLNSDTNQAIVRARLIYFLKDGRKSSEISTFRLVRQGDRWLFADVIR
ncbi:MAG: hypothetical protein AAF889_01625 [Cyanobacteria bacterium P01_D01_bin.73]